MPMQRRDALGRFISVGQSAYRGYHYLKGVATGVAVGVSAKTGDIRYKSHNISGMGGGYIVPGTRLSKYDRDYYRRQGISTRGTRRKRGRRPRKARKIAKRYKRVSKRGIKRKNVTSMNFGRQWPPTEMKGTFSREFHATMSAGASSTTTGHFSAWQLHAVVDSPGHYYNADNATATAVTITDIKPRNWDFMTALYKRCRLVDITHKLSIIMNDTTAYQNKSFILCWWFSSTLDQGNPMDDFSTALGSSAPFTSADEFRTILLQSRRVHRKILKGPGMPGGAMEHTISLKLGNGLKDRYGNAVIGGRHVRDATNNPGGSIATTDKDVASALTEFWGVDQRVNVLLMPQHDASAQLPTAFRLISLSTLEFYDRNLENQSAPA